MGINSKRELMAETSRTLFKNLKASGLGSDGMSDKVLDSALTSMFPTLDPDEVSKVRCLILWGCIFGKKPEVALSMMEE